jgi:N-acetylglutamate synthase-like GNAT family acetyltransferase
VTADSGTARVRPARAADYPAVVGLLEAARLPTAGLSPSLGDFLVADAGDLLLGAVGLEVYGSAALLRSAVVAPGSRGRGLGAVLLERMVAHARSRGVQDLYLLTTTAEGWFPRFGFARIGREAVPAALHASAEFKGACPDSAVAMHASLG